MKNLEPYAIAQCGEDGSEWANKMLPSFPNKGANRRRLLAMKEAGEAMAKSPRMFAAAPDLLAALEDCITSEGAACFGQMDSHPEWMQRRLYAISDIARAAIAKAKG